MSTKSVPPIPRITLNLPTKKQAVVAILAAAFALVFLAACSATTKLATEAAPPTVEPTATPVPIPTATAIPYGDFANAEIPPADPERLAQLTKLLSLVPESFNSAVFLDLESLKSNESLADLINPKILGMDVALPSIATGLVSRIAVASDTQNRSLVTPFQSEFAIGGILRLADGFGINLSRDGPTFYEGHDVWGINAFGTVLAMAAADDTTGVAAAGQAIAPEDARALAEASLDAFDGRSATLLDTPGLSGLLADVPSGFAAAVLSGCSTVPLFDDVQELSVCTGVVVTADILPGDLVVFHSLVGFPDQAVAGLAMEQAAEALEKENRSQGFEDLGVRQEGGNLRIRLIVSLPKFAEVFQLFAPSN